MLARSSKRDKGFAAIADWKFPFPRAKKQTDSGQTEIRSLAPVARVKSKQYGIQRLTQRATVRSHMYRIQRPCSQTPGWQSPSSNVTEKNTRRAFIEPQV